MGAGGLAVHTSSIQERQGFFAIRESENARLKVGFAKFHLKQVRCFVIIFDMDNDALLRCGSAYSWSGRQLLRFRRFAPLPGQKSVDESPAYLPRQLECFGLGILQHDQRF
jgi:hypothetical protein